MNQKIYQVDAFTAEAFKGNPAAVCVLTEEKSEKWMQSVAGEMNLSETAFILKKTEGYQLRWFTPTVEVELCGHATLASAHILWELELNPANEEISFLTRSGELKAFKEGECITLDFPSLGFSRSNPDQGVVAGIGAEPDAYYQSNFDHLLIYDNVDIIRKISPLFHLLSAAHARGIIVSARSDGAPYDFISRFFAPAAGVDEDPVTGSAHCLLAPYWAQELGKTKMLAHQASRRGGDIQLKLQDNRVLLSGQAVTVMQADLLI